MFFYINLAVKQSLKKLWKDLNTNYTLLFFVLEMIKQPAFNGGVDSSVWKLFGVPLHQDPDITGFIYRVNHKYSRELGVVEIPRLKSNVHGFYSLGRLGEIYANVSKDEIIVFPYNYDHHNSIDDLTKYFGMHRRWLNHMVTNVNKLEEQLTYDEINSACVLVFRNFRTLQKRFEQLHNEQRKFECTDVSDFIGRHYTFVFYPDLGKIFVKIIGAGECSLKIITGNKRQISTLYDFLRAPIYASVLARYNFGNDRYIDVCDLQNRIFD
ncbi:hypothetical protein DRJ17_03885 [Candidatus Woesearchaeota archaeon]|nr:MAG: hypothetical protein DRJ17_03885 [Candidatus Woesearchaeota archaeon]